MATEFGNGNAQNRSTLPEESISLDRAASNQNPPISVPVARIRESSRSFISVLIVGCLPLIILFSFISLWVIWYNKANGIEELKTILELVIGPVIAIVGAVTGFYFGEKSRD